MSVVTNVLVVTVSWFDRETMEPLTKQDDARDWRGAFTSVTDDERMDLWIHDGKAPECQVWVGAFNHLNRPALLADLESLRWDEPAGVKVLINYNDEETFGLWMFNNGRLQEMPLPGWHRRPLVTDARTSHGMGKVEVGYLERDDA